MLTSSDMLMNHVLRKFQIDSAHAEISLITRGHVNLAYEVMSQQGHFVLQKVNTSVFTNPVAMMGNISKVLKNIPELYLVKVDGKDYYEDESGFYRMYNYVQDSACYDVLTDENFAYRMGKGLQSFHNKLAKIDASQLYETIPAFHDMRSRYAQLEAAAESDSHSRLKHASEELGFLLENRKRGYMINDLYRSGMIRKVVTHNDAKLSNILFNKDTGAYITFIDFDTIMAGTVLYDIGDMLRSGCSSAAEDEKDLAKVEFLVSYYEAIRDGYLEGNAEVTKAERELFPECGRMMTQIVAVRFLADYLNGDVYFHTAYPEHNLVRCRNQIALIKDWDRKL